MTVSLIVLIGLVTAAFVWVAAARRLQRNHGRLRLHDAMRIRGLAIPDSEAALRRAAFASRRCLWCPAHEGCDKVLATGDWTAFGQICPNADYLESLRGAQASR